MHFRGPTLIAVLIASAVSCSDSSDDPPGEDDSDDNTPAEGSAGCGLTSALAQGTYAEQSLSVGGTQRPYFVRLPNGYDPQKPYPVVFENHGCSGSADRQNNNVPLASQVGDTAILVRGRAASNCWDTSTSGPDAAYLEALREAVDANWCVDTTRRYLTGYSGGAFMAHALACRSGQHFRAVATIAGGQNGGNSCTPNMPALLIHDAGDNTVDVSASRATRDGYIARNGCDTNAPPTATSPAPCVASVGCDAAVVYCETSGKDHDRQDALAGPAFWGFLSSFD